MNILKPCPYYKHEILGLLFQGNPLTSGEIHAKLIKLMEDKHPSRASVIQFLHYLEKYNHVTFEEESCQGGHKRVYTLKGTQEDFTHRLTLQMNTQFREEYLDPLEAV